jgi:sec-independent protein translocase protein TatA
MPQGWEWIIIAIVALLLFGGTRLAGIGKSAGKAIREFKEETSALKEPPAVEPPPSTPEEPQSQPERKPETEA